MEAAPAPSFPSLASSSVELVEWTEDSVVEFIRCLSSRPYLWDDVCAADPQRFLLTLLSLPNTAFFRPTEGKGWIWFTQITPGFSACVHVVAESRFLAGRDDILRDAIREVMEKLDLQRVSALVPSWLRGACKAASRVMTYEGEMRATMKYRGEWRSALLFSIVREDLGWT